MKTSPPAGRKNALLLAGEVSVQGVCLLAAVAAWLLGVPMTPASDLVLCAYLLISFGYWFLPGWLFPGRDPAAHRKALSPVPKPPGYRPPRRQGLGVIAAIWLAGIALEWLLYRAGQYRWYGVVMAQSVLYILNSLFLRKGCPLSAHILKNENNCCKSCTITAWDYAFFVTPLLFAPPSGTLFPVVRLLLLAAGFGSFVLWEVLYRRYPWRFYPRTNKTLTCAGCPKRCGGPRRT